MSCSFELEYGFISLIGFTIFVMVLGNTPRLRRIVLWLIGLGSLILCIYWWVEMFQTYILSNNRVLRDDMFVNPLNRIWVIGWFLLYPVFWLVLWIEGERCDFDDIEIKLPLLPVDIWTKMEPQTEIRFGVKMTRLRYVILSLPFGLVPAFSFFMYQLTSPDIEETPTGPQKDSLANKEFTYLAAACAGTVGWAYYFGTSFQDLEDIGAEISESERGPAIIDSSTHLADVASSGVCWIFSSMHFSDPVAVFWLSSHFCMGGAFALWANGTPFIWRKRDNDSRCCTAGLVFAIVQMVILYIFVYHWLVSIGFYLFYYGRVQRDNWELLDKRKSGRVSVSNADWRSQIQEGSKLQLLDRRTQTWFQAVVLKTDNRKYLLRYDGWSEEWDEWVPKVSKRLKPIEKPADAQPPKSDSDGDEFNSGEDLIAYVKTNFPVLYTKWRIKKLVNAKTQETDDDVKIDIDEDDDPRKWFGERVVDCLSDKKPEKYEYSSYHRYPNIPKRIKTLPFEQRLKFSNILKLSENTIKICSTLPFEKTKEECKSIDEYYLQIYDSDLNRTISSDYDVTLTPPPHALSKRWRRDAIFAAQYISGINPFSISRCKDVDAIKEKMGLTADQLKEIEQHLAEHQEQKEDCDLESMINLGRIFISDASYLCENLPEDRVFYPCVVLFYIWYSRNQQKCLLPLAIYLGREDRPEKQFYTPDENSLCWLYAKMCAANTDANSHILQTLVGNAYLALEPIIIAFHRALSKDDNLYKLMEPFFQHTLAVNNFGRSLISLGSIFDETIALGVDDGLKYLNLSFQNWSLDKFAVPVDLTNRGFNNDDEEQIPGYHYRTDGRGIWNPLKKFILSCLASIYKSDKGLQEDESLKKLSSELTSENKANLDLRLGTRNDLAETLTIIAYLTIGYHSAASNAFSIFYTFPPSRPLRLFEWMPEDPETVTEEFILSALPSYKSVAAINAVATALSLPVDHEVTKNLRCPLQSLEFPEFASQFSTFLKDLEWLNDDIDDRQGGYQPGLQPGDFPEYTHLKSNKLTSSAALL